MAADSTSKDTLDNKFDFDEYIRRIAREEILRVLAEREKQISTNDEWLTSKQVAAITKLTLWAVYELNRRGILKAEKPYGKNTRTLRWRRSAVDAYIQTGFVEDSN